MKIDAIDLRILDALQADGRTPRSAIAEILDIRPSEVSARIGKLEAVGVIRGYRAEIDPGRLAGVITVFLSLSLANREADDFARFERSIESVPAIVECHAVGGAHGIDRSDARRGAMDYMLRIVAADADHYGEILDGLMSAGVGIDHYQTFITDGAAKPASGLPLAELARARRAAKAAASEDSESGQGRRSGQLAS